MRTPFTVGLVLLAILLVAGFAFDSDDKPKPVKTEPATPIATIERRVERVRDLRYETLPRPQTVSPAQAKRDGYVLEFRGDGCEEAEPGWPECAGFAYVARPQRSDGSPTFALYSTDDKIRFRTDGRVPTRDDASIENRSTP